MKKVLALVLAAVMVCTMAFAAIPGWVGNDTTTGGSSANLSVLPTEKIVLKFVTNKDAKVLAVQDANGNDLKVCLTNNEFDVNKNTVKVSFANGGDLVASQGWEKDGNGYSYVIKTKENLNHIAGNAEIEISKITFSAYGETTANDPATIYDDSKVNDETAKLTFAYGYLGKDGSPIIVNINEKGELVSTDTNVDYNYLKNNCLNSVIKLVKLPDGKPTGDLALEITSNECTATATLRSGNVFTVKDASLSTSAQEKLDKNVTANKATVLASYDGLFMNTDATIKVTRAKDTYKAYSVDADGNATLLDSKMENGVMSFDVNNISAFVVVDGTLSATTNNGTNTTPGTGTNTTNPETGANDVLGVAAALAVVALISGAAISLKK